MELKDLTKEQTIEIAKLIYPFKIENDFEFHYQPYDETWMDDAREFVELKFNGIVFGDKAYPLRLEILPNLDCWFYYIKFDEKIGYNVSHSLPSRNQHKIQKLFIKWGIRSDTNDRYKFMRD
jgi:hypothetical protein